MKLIDFIICDDIRTEVGNKHSLVGVYSDAINFNVSSKESGKWPKVMKIGFFIRIKVENDEKAKINKFKLNINYNEKNKTMAEGVINLEAEKNTQGILLAIIFNQFIFESLGLMSVSLELTDKDGSVINNFEMPEKIKISENIFS